MLIPRQLAIAAVLAGILLAPAWISAASPVYPLKKSANGRYLVDQGNVPCLLLGESPQALTVNLTTNEAALFFANRSSHGFNTAWVNLLCATYTGGRPNASTIDGIVPFTGTVPASVTIGTTTNYDLTTPNEAFFHRVDQMLQLAAQEGIQVLLDPAETGSFLSVMLNNGTNKCRAYGQFLGNRYKNFPNIIWMSGNDFQSWRIPGDDAVVRAVALGIRDADTNHLQTTELDYLASSSLDDTNWLSLLGLNATYTYFPTYARLRQDYNRTNFLPVFLVEANYEFESLQGPVTTAPILRKQEYWTMTSGACGQLYGNGYTWPFLSGWQNQLDTPGAIQIRYLKSFFEARAWYNLVPDTNHLVVTASYGAYSDSGYVASNDYLTDARAADGSLVVIYTPILRQFTVDMSQLSGPAAAHWFDPAAGTYFAIAGSPFPNSGILNFTPPTNNADGDGGWVLVLETNPPPIPPPPPPPPPQPKFVQQNFTAPQSPQSQASVAYTNPQSAGNVNILAIGWNDTNASISTIADSAGNSYHVAVPTFKGNGLSQAIYFATNIHAQPNTVTVTFTQPAAYVDLRVTEYSGLSSDGAPSGGSSGTGIGTIADSGPVAVTTTNALLFGAGMTAGTFTAAGSGFALRVITAPDADIVEDRIAATGGVYQATASLSGSTAWLMQMAAFRPATNPPPLLRIFITTTNTVVVKWPAAAASFVLQENPNLSTTNWSDTTNTVGIADGECQAVLSSLSHLRFYRLKQP